MTNMNTPPTRQPALYIPHGAGPCFFMDWNPPDAWDATAAYLRSIAGSLPQRPDAIVLVTAHWLAPQFTAGSAARPGMLFDYYGFPQHTYQLNYPAAGALALAEQVSELIRAAGLPAALDGERGYDHGVFIPLLLAFPDADIPVLQLSLLQDLDPEAHLAMGRALAPLRDEGVLIIGSGMSFHERGPEMATASPPFDAWLHDAVLSSDSARRWQALAAWEEAPFARQVHPTADHLLPLMVAAGAAQDDAATCIYRERLMGTVAVSSFRFGN